MLLRIRSALHSGLVIAALIMPGFLLGVLAFQSLSIALAYPR
jgi:hypothetical protein